MHFFAYATMLTVLGIWGGPYLHDVHGLDAIQRGNVLLTMGVAQILGILAYGPMDRVLGSRKKVILAGAALSALAILPTAWSLPPWRPAWRWGRSPMCGRGTRDWPSRVEQINAKSSLHRRPCLP